MDEKETTLVFEMEEDSSKEKKESKKETKKKKSLKEKWQGFSKKKKILIIVCLFLIIAIIGIVVFFLLKKDVPVNNEIEEVILENQNYRYQEGTLYFYDKEKNEVGTYECKNKDEEKCYLAYYTNDLDIDNTKYIYEDEQSVLFQTPIVANKYVFVYDNKETKDEVIRLYNFKEQKEMGIYTAVKKGGDDYTFILKDSNGLYGVLSLKDESKDLVKFKYDYLGYYDAIKDSYFIASLNNKYFIINSDDKKLSSDFNNRIVGFNKEFVKVLKDSKYEVYDYKGGKRVNASYDYITFADKYIIAIKNNDLYILDGQGNNLNVDGLKLNNNYYNKTYFYDNDNKLLRIENSFEVSVDGNDINIDIYTGEEKETHIINALEALVNSKSEYISYIDGKLYFYSDLEKKNKIGSYSCKNKNEITSEESELSSCYLAKLIDGMYMPIINNRYAFINDTLDSSKQSISLYDLKDNKTLSNYLEIDALLPSDSRFIIANSLNVIALSAKKNKYGMIIVGSESVKSAIEFTNNEIKSLNGFYSVNKSSGTYQVYDKEGNSLTSEFANEIVSYDPNLKTVMTINNEKYRLYNSTGKELTNKAYERIDCYQNYIVALDAKKLDIIDYNGNIIANDIELYTDDYNNAYSIDSDKVLIYNGNLVANEVSLNKEG